MINEKLSSINYQEMIDYLCTETAIWTVSNIIKKSLDNVWFEHHIFVYPRCNRHCDQELWQIQCNEGRNHCLSETYWQPGATS